MNSVMGQNWDTKQDWEILKNIKSDKNCKSLQQNTWEVTIKGNTKEPQTYVNKS